MHARRHGQRDALPERMDGFEGDFELNMQLGLALMKVEDWFKPFNDTSVPPYVH